MPTVLIAGANRGLGLEYARQYLTDDWDVVATARDVDAAGELAALGAVEVHPLDITSLDSVNSLAAALKNRPLDLVICNAGIYGPDDQSFDAMDYDAWLRTFDVNTLGPFRVAQALRPNLKAAAANGTSKLALMTSRKGSISSSSGDEYAYRSSKAALNMVGHGLALYLRQDAIAVLLLHPGSVQTDMGEVNAPLKAQESIRGLRRVIAGMTMEKTGAYVDYRGKSLAW